MVHAFIHSRMDYCNSLLTRVSDVQIQRLQSLKNAAARLVTGLRRWEHITPTLLSLHLLPVRQRLQFKIATTVFRCLNNMAPTLRLWTVPPSWLWCLPHRAPVAFIQLAAYSTYEHQVWWASFCHGWPNDLEWPASFAAGSDYPWIDVCTETKNSPVCWTDRGVFVFAECVWQMHLIIIIIII